MSALRLLRISPIVKAALTSGTVMAGGDAICQAIQDRKDHEGLHWRRVMNFSIVGFTLHGPMFYLGYQALDRLVGPQKTFQMAMRKAAINHCTLFPIYAILFFTYNGVLEGKPVQQALDKAQAMLMKTWIAGTFVWPLVNTLGFKFVPMQWRILYINSAGLLWNIFMSYLNQEPHITDDIPPEEVML